MSHELTRRIELIGGAQGERPQVGSIGPLSSEDRGEARRSGTVKDMDRPERELLQSKEHLAGRVPDAEEDQRADQRTGAHLR